MSAGVGTPPPQLRRAVPVAAALTLWCTSPLTSQDGVGSLEGVVRSGADDRPIAGAVVLLRGTPLRSTTDAGGRFRFIRLTPGRYALRAVAAGYQSLVLPDVDVVAGAVRRVEVTLEKALVELPGVVVTASRTEARPGDAPASVAVVSNAEIVRRNVLTIRDALPFAQGVIFNGGQLDIRGSTGLSLGVGSRVLLLLDGHRVLGGATGQMDFDALPILDVARVEIVKGPHSTLYGSNALGGVVNVITQPIAGPPRTIVKAHYGFYQIPSEFGYTDEHLSMQGIDVQHARRLGPVGTMVSFGRKTSDGFHQNGNYSRWFARGKLVLPMGDAKPWEVYAIWARNDRGEFLTWRAADRPFEVEPDAVGDWVRSDKLSAGATITPVVTPGLLLEVRPQLYWKSARNHSHDNQDFDRSTRVGTDLQLSFNPGARHGVTLGAEGFWTGVRSNFLGEPEVYDVSAYAQDEIALSERVTASVGVRLDYHVAELAEREVALSPKVGLVFRANERVSYRASFGRGYRAPSPSEQFVSTTVAGFRVVPNPELGGETAWAGDVGLTAAVGGRLRVDGAFFWSEYVDLIEPASAPGQLFVFQFRNVARARVRGVDLGAEVGLVDGLLGWKVTYTYLDTEDTRTGEPLPYRSTHNVTSTFEGEVAPGAMVGLDLQYRSAVERVLVFPLDARGAITTVGLRLGYRVRGVELQAKVSNLLQDHYVDVRERNAGAPRSVMVTAFTRF